MKLRHLGYACVNVSLGCTTGKTLRLANLNADRLGGVVEQNLGNLRTILSWNLEHGIRFFRVSSEAIPFAGHASFPLDWQAVFAPTLSEIRAFVRAHALRLSMHPGQYTVLNSPRADVALAARMELDYHARFIRSVDPWQGTVTLHVGGAYGDKARAVDRFAQAFAELSAPARETLILENDDRVYGAREVLELCERLQVPMVFDLFHHHCHHGGNAWHEGLGELLERVVATWRGRVPKFHLSSLKPGSRTSHADLVTQDDFASFVRLLDDVSGDAPYDLMLEAKRKDQAVLALRS